MSDCPCEGKCPDCACQQLVHFGNPSVRIENVRLEGDVLSATVYIPCVPKYVPLTLVVSDEEKP